MYDFMMKFKELPPVFQETEGAFWDDEHISGQMLKAHLDPEFSGASRKHSFIEKSVAWINDTIPSAEYPALLDVGCGPGIYGEGFARSGYKVTGVDFSKRSVNYAAKSAEEKGLKIHYIYQDYLKLDLNRTFDMATMIYCDYGALSIEKRRILMDKVYRHLKPGGKFLLDVFSMAKYKEFREQQIWEIHKEGGFWSGSGYGELNRCCKYPDHITLEQTAIISEGGTKTYYLWNSYYTRDSLIEEVSQAGFKVCGVYGDVAGSPYSEESPTIAIILEK